MDRVTRWVMGIGMTVSVVAMVFLTWLIYINNGLMDDPAAWVAWLPTLNAGLNTLSALCVCAGIVAIRAQKKNLHRLLMLLALLASAAFLVGYVVYHAAHGDTPYTGGGWLRPVYFFVLISHIVLTIGGLPMILMTAGLGLTGRFTWHKRLGRWTFPIWLYISVTGVVIYAMLRSVAS